MYWDWDVDDELVASDSFVDLLIDLKHKSTLLEGSMSHDLVNAPMFE